MGRGEGWSRSQRDHVRRGAHGKRGRRRADCGARDRNGAAQDGHAWFRRDACRERLGQPTRVQSAIGTAPIPPVAKSDIRAIGRTNDCVLYGGQARYTVRAADDELASLAEKLPSSASADYGTPFIDIFKRYDNDFYKIDPMLFSPAEVWLTSTSSGRTFYAGRLDPAVLRASLFEST